jgi:hypothetical protein
MEKAMHAFRMAIFSLLIAASLLVGWFIPKFYIWTDSDQSRPSPLLWQVPLGSAIVSMAFCIVLPWLPITNQKSDKTSNQTSKPRLQFSLRTLLLVTAIVAGAIVLLAKFPLVMSGIVTVGAFMYLISFFVSHPQHRLATSALIASMNLPFVWILGHNKLSRISPSLLAMFPGLPAFFPAFWMGTLFNQNLHDRFGLALLLTSLEMMIGIWMIRLGRKLAIAYLLLVLHVSAFGSLVFHTLIIAILG